MSRRGEVMSQFFILKLGGEMCSWFLCPYYVANVTVSQFCNTNINNMMGKVVLTCKSCMSIIIGLVIVEKIVCSFYVHVIISQLPHKHIHGVNVHLSTDQFVILSHKSLVGRI